MDPQPEEPKLPGSILLSEWHYLKERYAQWGVPKDPRQERKRAHRSLEKYYNPEWPPYTMEREIPERITDIMRKYHEYTKGKAILLYEFSDPTNHLAIPYTVRGTDEYKDKVERRLKRIRADWDQRPGNGKAMLITISPRQIGSVWTLHQQLKALWPKLTDWMRHRFHYTLSIWSAEPNKRHYTHFHMVINGLHPKGLLAQEIISWLKGYGVDIENPGVEVEICRRHPVGYAVKYVRKGTDDLFWQGMMWMDCGRMWGCSRGLGRPRKTKSEVKWIYCGPYMMDYYLKYREHMVWGDVLPSKLAEDQSAREKYYDDVY